MADSKILWTEHTMQTDEMKSANTNAAPRARSVPAFAKHIGVGKSTCWELVKDGKLRAVRINGRTLILHEDGEKFLRSLPAV
jgi:excisionase family DNA binding protein